MNICINGSRTFTDYNLLATELDRILGQYDKKTTTIIVGGAKGADRLAESYARLNGYQYKVFPANWELHGKAAGHIRNQEMVNVSDMLISFWDGISKGTKNAIELAKKRGISVEVILWA